MKEQNARSAGHDAVREGGYVLLLLLLTMALLVIAAAVAAPSLAFQLKRDREEELIHRGVQYSRAIRTFASKTGRFPLKLEDLQETGGVRYIRKLYKDPLTGGDFKLLHMTDLPSAGGMSNLNPTSQTGAVNQSIPRPDPVPSSPENATTDPAASSSDTSNSDQTGNPSSGKLPSTTTTAGAQLSGGVILGVASKSKDKTIREFNHKNHYNDWLFFYYPPYGGNQLTGPTPLTTSNAPMQGAAGAPVQSQGENQPQTEGVPVQQ